MLTSAPQCMYALKFDVVFLLLRFGLLLRLLRQAFWVTMTMLLLSLLLLLYRQSANTVIARHGALFACSPSAVNPFWLIWFERYFIFVCFVAVFFCKLFDCSSI